LPLPSPLFEGREDISVGDVNPPSKTGTEVPLKRDLGGRDTYIQP